MRFAWHRARICDCGAGYEGIVAEVAPACVVEADIRCDEDVDRLEIAGVRMTPVRCHGCGRSAPATHLVTRVDGRTVGVESAAELMRYHHAERARERELAERLGPTGPVPDGLAAGDLA